MTLRITQYGEPILRQKGSPITSFDDKLTDLANQMLEAMEQADGIGLAAQQIGQALQFCVVDVPDHPEYPMTCILDDKPLSPSLLMPIALANPEITPLPSDEYYYEKDVYRFHRYGEKSPARRESVSITTISMAISTGWNAMVCLPVVYSMKWII